MSTKPNVLIFGGMNGLAPILALHLVPLSGEPLVSHLRMADKYAMNPPTTYVIKDLLTVLQDRKDIVEYRQTNLTVEERIHTCFADPSPNGEPYTHIIDLTGEVEFDRSPEIYVSHTFNVALTIALEASRRSVKSYIRHMPPSYEHLEYRLFKEEEVEGWKPWGTRGIWWHETIRAIGSIPNLPFILVRGGVPYGPGVVRGPMATVFCNSLVYKQRNEDLRFFWSPQLRRSTIHCLDWAPAMWTMSVWAAERSRTRLDELIGVSILPTGDDIVEVTERTVKKAQGGVIVPTFNLADEGDLDAEKLARVLGNVFGIKTGFRGGSVVSRLVGQNLESVFEHMNDLHLSEWAQIISTSNPRILSTPLFPILYIHQLKKSGCAFDGERFRKLTGYKLKYPAFNEDTARQTIDSWRAEGIWPNTNLYPPSSDSTSPPSTYRAKRAKEYKVVSPIRRPT